MPTNTAVIAIMVGVVHTPRLLTSAKGRRISHRTRKRAVCLHGEHVYTHTHTHTHEWPPPNTVCTSRVPPGEQQDAYRACRAAMFACCVRAAAAHSWGSRGGFALCVLALCVRGLVRLPCVRHRDGRTQQTLAASQHIVEERQVLTHLLLVVG